MLDIISAENILKRFYFSQKRLDMSYGDISILYLRKQDFTFPVETVRIRCEVLFEKKNKKNTKYMSPAELAQCGKG